MGIQLQKRHDDRPGFKGNQYILCDEVLHGILRLLHVLFYMRNLQDTEVNQYLASDYPKRLFGFGVDRGDLVTIIHYLMDQAQIYRDTLALLQGWFEADLAHYQPPFDPDEAPGWAQGKLEILAQIRAALNGQPGPISQEVEALLEVEQ